jgi:murein DD-endopeptidase MepM/ murein hydrolase activator NlpD
VDKVHLPNGSLDYFCIEFSHDNNPPITTIGQVVSQGQLCYHTGTYGYVTGDHVHTCVGQGHYQGITQRSSGNWDLTNRIHYWDGVFVNDTVIRVGYGHDWKIWDGPVPPTPTRSRNKFPWVLYANRLRLKRQL